MGNNLREDLILPDLNQVPLGQPQNLGIRLESIRTEEQIQRIGVHNQPAVTHLAPVGNASLGVRNESVLLGGVDRIAGDERGLGSQKYFPKNSTDLIANALEMDSFHRVGPRYNGRNGGLYNCHVCLNMAKEPILTCCGHLYCWPCFYNLPYEHSDVKECPACGGDVADSSLIPIYGNGDLKSSCKRKKSGLEVPPRPKAKRVENPKQRRGTRGLSTSQIEQRLQQLTTMARRAMERDRSFSPSTESTSDQDIDALNFSRLILQGASSLRLISSALEPSTDSEMLIESPEEFSNSRRRRSSHEQSPSSEIP